MEAHGIQSRVFDADNALSALRAAVRTHRRNGRDFEDLRRPLRDYCARARREAMAPEQVLVQLKHALDELPRPDIDNAYERDTIRSRLISFAILSYFTDAE